MATEKLSPARRAILALLTESPALTTSQIAGYLARDTTRRALQQHLAGLRDAGLIAEGKCRPELGQVSLRSWTLLAAGRTVLANDEADLLTLGRPGPPLTPNRASILELLAEWKQLTTVQIWRYLHSDLSLRYTQALLTHLKRGRMVRDAALDPTLGAAAEHYWMLLSLGATAIGTAYDKQYRQRPSRDLLGYRGLQLDLINQIAGAGWAVHRPVPFRPSRPRPAETPQYQQLVTAIVHRERKEIAQLLAAGQAQTSLQPRLARAEAGQVGGLVPHGINEYVAYMPGQPEQAALLLPHPPYAGRAFWTRKPEPVHAQPEQDGRRDSRVDRYGRLATIVPVIAVFPNQETGYQYAPLLQRAGFDWVVVEALASRLIHLAVGAITAAQ